MIFKQPLNQQQVIFENSNKPLDNQETMFKLIQDKFILNNDIPLVILGDESFVFERKPKLE